MKNLKKLTIEQMKVIVAGFVPEEEEADGTNAGSWKCCWVDTDNCSICVSNAKPKCVKGAVTRPC